jgi:hypothetical protein
MYYYFLGSVMIEVQCYNPEGREFDPIRSFNFINLSHPFVLTRSWCLLSL